MAGPLRATVQDEDFALAKLTELALLGALSLRLGKRIEWNSEQMKATNAPEAESVVRVYYRKNWEIKV